VQGEPDDEQHRQGDLAGLGGLADRQPFREIVQPDPDRDRHAYPHCRLGGGRLSSGFGGSHGARADAGRWTGLPQPGGVQQPEQPGSEPERVHHRQPGEVTPCRLAGLGIDHGLLDRLGGVGQDVEQQEHQDAGRQGVEERPARLTGKGHPPKWQAEEDREPGDGTEEDRLGRGHRGSGLLEGELG
jgi:hypothetical protein